MLAKLSLAVSFISLVLILVFFFIFTSRLSILESKIDSNQKLSVDIPIVNLEESTSPQTISQQIDYNQIQKLITNEVSRATSTISAQTTTLSSIQTKPTATTKPKTSTTYLPINSNFASGSQDWVDVTNSNFTLDLANDYGSNAIAVFDLYLKVQDGNGQAYVRIYDKTHGIVVYNSELQTANQTSTNLISNNLSFWSGKNNYVVQIKSLTGYSVSFETGRLKITY